jgi:hypothetical protein
MEELLLHTIKRLRYCLTIEQDIRVAAEIHLAIEEIEQAIAQIN